MNRRSLIGLVLGLAASGALAQDLTYGPPELIEAAKKEGKMTLYVANFLDPEQAVAKAFNKRFPFVRVEIVRAPGGQLITRVRTEAAAGRLIADVVDHSDRTQMAAMNDMFAPYAPPNADLYPANVRASDRIWPRSGIAWTIAYNTALVANPPKSWHDLTHPAYGRLGLGQTVAISGGAPWTRAMFERQVLGEEYWARQAALKPQLYPSQAPMVDAMIRGEIALAPLVTSLAVPKVSEGAPIKWIFATEGAPITLFAAGIPKTAPNPNAARLFMNWSLSREGQEVYVEQGSFTGMRDGPLPPGVDWASLKTWLPDMGEYERLHKPWIEDWNRVYNYRQ